MARTRAPHRGGAGPRPRGPAAPIAVVAAEAGDRPDCRGHGRGGLRARPRERRRRARRRARRRRGRASPGSGPPAPSTACPPATRTPARALGGGAELHRRGRQPSGAVGRRPAASGAFGAGHAAAGQAGAGGLPAGGRSARAKSVGAQLAPGAPAGRGYRFSGGQASVSRNDRAIARRPTRKRRPAARSVASRNPGAEREEGRVRSAEVGRWPGSSPPSPGFLGVRSPGLAGSGRDEFDLPSSATERDLVPSLMALVPWLFAAPCRLQARPRLRPSTWRTAPFEIRLSGWARHASAVNELMLSRRMRCRCETGHY